MLAYDIMFWTLHQLVCVMLSHEHNFQMHLSEVIIAMLPNKTVHLGRNVFVT